jgi:hypothetical protein
MFNTSVLSALNPFTWLQTILIWLGLFAVGLIVGGIGGCNYKQNQWDAEKFRQMEKAKKQEQQDAAVGVEKIGELKEDKKEIEAGKTFIGKELGAGAGSKPLIIYRDKVVPVACPQINPNPSTSVPGVSNVSKDPVFLMSPHFMRLHDVSAKPGDIEIRTRTYGASEEATLDEGFEKVIVPNNLSCAEDRVKLQRLQERIIQKQRVFKQEGN